MPYIKPEMRESLDQSVQALATELANITDEHSLDGALNYTICRLTTMLYKERYFDFNRIMGVLECVKMEVYRRRAVPYEDQKIVENGDVEGWDE